MSKITNSCKEGRNGIINTRNQVSFWILTFNENLNFYRLSQYKFYVSKVDKFQKVSY